MRRELQALRKDMESGFAQARAELLEETTKLAETDRRIAVEVARLGGRMETIEVRMQDLATKDDVSRIISHIVSFSRDVEAAQRDRDLSSKSYVYHQRLLEDHEVRLSKLEEPKS